MSRARISEKGQITIPAAIRHALGLRPGDEVGFIADTPQPRLIPLPRSRVGDLYGVLATPRTLPGRDEARRKVAEALAQHYDRRARRTRREIAAR